MKLRSAIEVCTEIQNKRVEMMELAKRYGINNEETVRSSQELDVLINEYLIMQHHSDVNEKGPIDHEVLKKRLPFELNVK